MEYVFNKIDRIISKRNITARQLINAIGMSVAGYYKMVKSGDVKLSTLENICTYLKIDIKELLSSEISEINNLNQVSEPQSEYKRSPAAANYTNTDIILKDIAHIETLLSSIKKSLNK